MMRRPSQSALYSAMMLGGMAFDGHAFGQNFDLQEWLEKNRHRFPEKYPEGAPEDAPSAAVPPGTRAPSGANRIAWVACGGPLRAGSFEWLDASSDLRRGRRLLLRRGKPAVRIS